MTDWLRIPSDEFELRGLRRGENGLQSDLYHAGVRVGIIEIAPLEVHKMTVLNPEYQAIHTDTGDLLVVQKRT